ncbi:hypothetical protein ACFO3O_11700 [Dokdonia ponticola]|uniref:Outer membrane protein beta-barrel domain-containing protein n=1 Tax=Dokdonia ponticola TaxID=2041041 RepID=A0ABV9HWP3_9FLAO
MKKTIFCFVLFLGIAASMQAQEISKNAIGIRIGDNDGFGTEVNYQRGLGDNNRLELGLGWRSADNFDAIRFTGLYQWVWNLDGGFNWYAGVGAAVGSFDFDDRFVIGRDIEEFFLNAAGTVGIEYNFDIPLLLSLDFRPEIGILNDIDDDLEFDVALSIRYQF